MRRSTGLIAIALPAALCAGPARAECVWSDIIGTDPRVAEVRHDAPRVPLLWGEAIRKGCPSAAPACRQKGYLVPGDVVLVGKSVGDYSCIGYIGARGPETISFLPTAALSPWPAGRPAPTDWAGSWRAPERTLTIAAAPGGALKVQGDATWGMGDQWRRANGGVHLGEVGGVARPVGGVLAFTMGEDRTLPYDAGEETDCRVRMLRRGPYLLVYDTGNCGGLNVSFSGIYRRGR